MPEPHQRIYELAKDALADQRVTVDGLRSRAAPVAAAAAVLATLLADPVFAGKHPSGVAEWAFTGMGLIGVALLLVAFVGLFSRPDLRFAVDTDELVEQLDSASADETDLLIAGAFATQRELNQPGVDQLYNAFTTALTGLVLEAVGFAAAAALGS